MEPLIVRVLRAASSAPSLISSAYDPLTVETTERAYSHSWASSVMSESKFAPALSIAKASWRGDASEQGFTPRKHPSSTYDFALSPEDRGDEVTVYLYVYVCVCVYVCACV